MFKWFWPFLFFDYPQAKSCFCPADGKDRWKLEISWGRDCSNLPYYCHLEFWDYFTHLLHDSFEMPFTVCPNRELLFLSFMARKIKISSHSKREVAGMFPFYIFLYFALRNVFWKIFGLKKKCVSMYRCIHFSRNVFFFKKNY